MTHQFISISLSRNQLLKVILMISTKPASRNKGWGDNRDVRPESSARVYGLGWNPPDRTDGETDCKGQPRAFDDHIIS